jgi:hypothetical protein
VVGVVGKGKPVDHFDPTWATPSMM